MARSSKRRSSKRARPSFAEWKASLVAIRESVGFDLREPVGFSEYLLALYGKDPVFHTDDPYHPIISPSYHREMAPGGQKTQYATLFKAWCEALAPHGMICARGLHSLGFLPGDDVPAMVYANRARHGRDPEMWSATSDFSSYSMNLPIAVNWFATNRGKIGKPGNVLRVSPLLARAASAVDPRALEAVDTATEKLPPDIRAAVAKRAAARGQTPPPDWSELAPAVRNAIFASECPVVIVVDGKPADMHGWGGDSESGDTMEAEIHMRHCEPRCVQRFFVASALHKLGKPVRADERRYFALDEHMVVTGRKIGFYDAPKLILHPDAPAKGKIVKNLSPDWTWYEVAV